MPLFFEWTQRVPDCTVLSMIVCGQEFSEATLNRLRDCLAHEPALSRAEVSRQVCSWLGWRSATGRLKTMSCRKALMTLQRKGVIKLPESKRTWAFQQRSAAAEESLPELVPVSGSLADVAPVELILIRSRSSAAARIWKGLMRKHHYLGDGPLCGAQLRYLIWSKRAGWLGGLSFSAAAWRTTVRDRHIGWSETARRSNLHLVVNNTRFLILPSVRVPHLASHVLARVCSRVPEDWKTRYGYVPVLAETFVERGRFHGTCYRAANWVPVGATAGRGRQNTGEPVKDVFLYPLRKDWRRPLCTQPDGSVEITPPRQTLVPRDWIEEEFGAVDLGDQRLTGRLLRLAGEFYAKPMANIPEACGTTRDVKAAYRFFDNERVNLQAMLAAHYQAAEERLSEEKIVLAVQDTTALDFTPHPATVGVGPIGTVQQTIRGLLLHSVLALTTEGTPLGLLDVQCWARREEEMGKRSERREKPIEEKESYKWIAGYQATAAVQQRQRSCCIVSVCDREADIHELFVAQRDTPRGAQLLVRNERSRRRQVEESEALWERLEREPVAGVEEIGVTAAAGRLPRIARMEIRFARVELQAPRDKTDMGAVPVAAVYAREVNAPVGVDPLDWMLVTTVAVPNYTAARKVLGWYAKRWGIEIFHRILKSGCRTEDRQLLTARRLENCLAIDLVVAWRIQYLTLLGRETPEVPCTVSFSDEEWKALVGFMRQDPSIPEKVPSLHQAVRMVAQLGGFLNRTADGQPGSETIWRGLQRLDDIAQAYRIFALPKKPAELGQAVLCSGTCG